MKAMDRQINEALRTKNTEVNVRMNSSSEWRADRIPRASFTAPGLVANVGGGQGKTEGEDRREEGGTVKMASILISIVYCLSTYNQLIYQENRKYSFCEKIIYQLPEES